MKIRMLKTANVQGFRFEFGKEYEIEDKLALWMIERNMASDQVGLPKTVETGKTEKDILEDLNKIAEALLQLREDVIKFLNDNAKTKVVL